MSSTFYTITQETLKRKLLSDELIEEAIRRVIELDQKEWSFTFGDLQVEIVKRHKHKIEFFVSRDIPKWESGKLKRAGLPNPANPIRYFDRSVK